MLSRVTRAPARKIFYGDYLTNAQGEDVVAGIRTPVHLTELAEDHAEGICATGEGSSKT